MKPNESSSQWAAYIKGFLVEADPTRIRCVDERLCQNLVAGIQIPGATSGVIDALKIVLGISEEEAWRLARDQGIPIDAHDDNQLGANGCGYAHLVETDPSSVGAVAAITAASRLARVRPPRIQHSVGVHAPVYAAINHVVGTTLDTNRILADGTGTFNLDAWALPQIADRLGLLADEKARLRTHVLDAYKRTVTALAGNVIDVPLELH